VERVTRSDVEKYYILAKICGMNVIVLDLDLALLSHASVGFLAVCCLQLSRKMP